VFDKLPVCRWMIWKLLITRLIVTRYRQTEVCRPKRKAISMIEIAFFYFSRLPGSRPEAVSGCA